MDVRIKRVYEPVKPEDGIRVLVDRLWPRGVAKSDAALDLWSKDAAPSPELRGSWHADPEAHNPEHFATFAEEYRAELAEQPGLAAVQDLVELARSGERVTLLYGARNKESNHAIVLREAVLELATQS